ncbi:hypothetical protein Gotri_005905 [Gossypium trilobum]|uniref:Uncharacterized protein n=1 Tax=Gossypium trilobum TaxID=34281 RepID=A0A7J9EY69_9ROSI|nr:hypothetical protein [Gossypium trilobum]
MRMSLLPFLLDSDIANIIN